MLRTAENINPLKEKLSLSLMGSMYNFDGVDIMMQKDGDEIWFRGKDVAEALGYKRPSDAIREHVDEDDKKKVMQESNTVKHRVCQSMVYLINEPGVYSLVFSSKLPSAKRFKNWVLRDVIPSIRKTGQYTAPRLIGNQLSLMSEADLHHQVISYIRRYYPDAIIIPGLGENQDTASKRITSWKKGYRSGQPDIIGNLNKAYTGLAIELKTPKGWGTPSNSQKSFIDNLANNGYKTLVSYNYDEIHRCIDEYMTGVRVRCGYCGRKFHNKDTLNNHCRGFHRISYTL